MQMRKDISKMLLKSVILLFVGLCSGLVVAAGTFAFFVVIRVLPRMIQKAKLEHKVIFIENILIRGILFGTVLSFFLWRKKWLYVIFGKTLLTFYGLSAGIFSGCIAVALAEILDTFPIFFRRLRIKEHLAEGLLFVMALGKMAGSLFYFFSGYGILGP